MAPLRKLQIQVLLFCKSCVDFSVTRCWNNAIGNTGFCFLRYLICCKSTGKDLYEVLLELAIVKIAILATRQNLFVKVPPAQIQAKVQNRVLFSSFQRYLLRPIDLTFAEHNFHPLFPFEGDQSLKFVTSSAYLSWLLATRQKLVSKLYAATACYKI